MLSEGNSEIEVEPDHESDIFSKLVIGVIMFSFGYVFGRVVTEEEYAKIGVGVNSTNSTSLKLVKYSRETNRIIRT